MPFRLDADELSSAFRFFEKLCAMRTNRTSERQLLINDAVLKAASFYFGDVNLATDEKLRFYIKADPRGFVPLSILKSLSLFQEINASEDELIAALRACEPVVVSEDGTAVRRKRPMRRVSIDEVKLRAVVVENLPPNATTESISELFGAVGPVALVRVIDPCSATFPLSKTNPRLDEIVKGAMGQSSRDANYSRPFAIVEYTTEADAIKAAKTLSCKSNWRTGMRVLLSTRRRKESVERKKHASEELERARARSCSFSSVGTNSPALQPIPDTLSKGVVRTMHATFGYIDPEMDSEKALQAHSNSKLKWRKRNFNKLITFDCRQVEGNVKPKVGDIVEYRGVRNQKKEIVALDVRIVSRPGSSLEEMLLPGSAFSTPEKPARPALHPGSASSRGSARRRTMSMEVRFRQADGPDGTRGFHAGRGRGRGV